jgi:hypothetical protein
MAKYKLAKNIDTGVVDKVILTDGAERWWINLRADNDTFRHLEYLEWKKNGGTPDPAD